MLKQWYDNLLLPNHEEHQLLHFVNKFAKPGSRILDVGCGYGRFLKPLAKMNYDVIGVEANAHIVATNRQQGLNCIHVDELKNIDKPVDLIIMSHIIEHFDPQALFAFMNTYLEKLAPTGHIVIATPLYSDYFFDDFDHVRPYHPLGLQMVFGGDAAQVQYYSKHRLSLRDLWFRKSPWLTTFQRAKYIKSPATRLLQLMDLFTALVFQLSRGILGRKTGWVGVFQKETSAC